MTNTESPATIEFTQAVEFAQASAERRAADAEMRAEDVLLKGDYAYLVAWKAAGLVKVQVELAALSVAKEHGPEALAARLVEFLVVQPTSSDPFANAVTIAQAQAARELLATFRDFLPADAVLARL